MRLVSISFDPEYDTPQRLASYSGNVREEKSGCEWHFVTTKSRTELQPILAAYDQAVDKRPNESDPQAPFTTASASSSSISKVASKHLQLRYP